MGHTATAAAIARISRSALFLGRANQQCLGVTNTCQKSVTAFEGTGGARSTKFEQLVARAIATLAPAAYRIYLDRRH